LSRDAYPDGSCFVGACYLQALVDRGLIFWGRLPLKNYTHKEKLLSDGSYLVTLLPKGVSGFEEALKVRVIEYTIEER